MLNEDVDRIIAVHPGKEQALILVNEIYDDSLADRLKKLIAKEFTDLTNFMGNMENKVTKEHMIRVRKIEMKFDKDKEEAILKGMQP